MRKTKEMLTAELMDVTERLNLVRKDNFRLLDMLNTRTANYTEAKCKPKTKKKGGK